MVFAAWRSFKRQQELHSRDASHLERLHCASKLRRVLEAASRAFHSDAAQSAESQRRWLVGPGRLLRPDEDLRSPGERRSGPPQLSRRWPLESRRMGPRRGQLAWTYSFWQRHGALFPPQYRSALVRLLAEEQRQPSSERGAALSDRQRHVGEIRFLAAARSENAESLFS